VIPYYSRSLDFEKLIEEYPPAPLCYERVYAMPRSELDALRQRRFREQMQRAWEIPFYQRHWKQAGFEPGDIRGLEDLHKIPKCSVYDFRDSIAAYPPFGDFMGVSPADGAHMPISLQSSGGTTGVPRPMLYTPKDREVMAILRSRTLHMHGVRPGDVAQVVLALGLPNGGAGLQEALWKYSGVVPLITGPGAVTPTRRQIEIALAWKTTVLIGFPAYLRHMGIVARDEMGIDPKSLSVRLIDSYLGTDDRTALEELWGVPAYDCYGGHEAGNMASECVHKNGMHIYEDAYEVEICDAETGKRVADGERGNIVVTTFFKYSAPLIRYDYNDVSAIMPAACECGIVFRRLERLFGRSDNMIKIRGVNVFPEAVASILGNDAHFTGEYLCLVEATGPSGADELTIVLESLELDEATLALREPLVQLFREGLGLRVAVDLVGRGSLDEMTGLHGNTKVKRVLDKRKK
jgi:phenylacetate-CoA ligase